MERRRQTRASILGSIKLANKPTADIAIVKFKCTQYKKVRCTDSIEN